MPLAPAAKALIVVSSICVAAGVALYESEHAREDILEWWADIRHKTSETWNDIIRDLSERFNMSPEERRARAREIILMAGGMGRTPSAQAATEVRAEERQPGSAEDARRRRRELFELARGTSSGVDEVPERALRAGAIMNESAAVRRRNMMGPFVDSQDVKAVSAESSSNAATLASIAAMSTTQETDDDKDNIDDDDASSTTASYSHIYTPTSSLSEFGEADTQDEFESARSGAASPSTLSMSSSMSIPSEDELSDAGTEILGDREVLLDDHDDVRSVSSVTSGRSAWTDVSGASSAPSER